MEALDKIVFLFQYLLQGLGVTVGVTLIALALGFALGMSTAVMRVYGNRFATGLAAAYSTVVRAVPVVVIIFILFLVIAKFIDLSPFLAGALALGFASGAYQSEIFRGALLAVPPGQMKAARAIGLSRLKAIRFIIMPQALRLAIPAWSNEATLVLKDSTLVYVIGVPEILRQAQYVSARTLQPFLAYAAAAAIYLGMTFLVIRVLHAVERRHRLLL
jgi:polar amino acid transport system permease protein